MRGGLSRSARGDARSMGVLDVGMSSDIGTLAVDVAEREEEGVQWFDGPEHEDEEDGQIFKDTKDPFASSGVAIQSLTTLGDPYNQSNQEQTDRDEHLSEQCLSQGMVEGRISGSLDSGGAAFDDDDKGCKDDETDALKDVAREEDQAGCSEAEHRVITSLLGGFGTRDKVLTCHLEDHKDDVEDKEER